MSTPEPEFPAPPSLRLLPWQQPVWQVVEQTLAQRRLGHALLLSGARGTGKREFARLLTAALWCRAPGEDRLPCGNCPDCRQVQGGVHPGLVVLRPEEDKRDIAIDAVRGLCERLGMTSHDGRAKAAVIDPADALNRNGFNALLKTVEEPPPGSHVILISERPLALPPTLRSRCQQLRLPVPSRESARAWLTSAAPPFADLDGALASAAGAPLQALRMLQDGSLERHTAWRRLMLELAAGRQDPLKSAEEIGEDQVGAFVRWLYSWILGIVRDVAGGTADDNGASPLRLLPPGELGSYVDELVGHTRRLESNAKAQLVLEALLIRWRLMLARAASQ